jgi:MFS family permease
MRMVGEQLQKIAASKAAAVEGKLAEAAVGVGKKVDAPPAAAKPAAQQAFDVGKFAGIFAAIGLAVGAIGTALAAVLTGLLALKWWQIPLAIGGLMLLISAPAMVLAWFKLRSRNLGPILDANGWAVNARARINIPFGTSLTQLAQLPQGAERALTDPYAEKERPWKVYLAIAVVIFVAAAWWTR